MILNYRHAQRRRVSIFFHTIPGVASRETAFPRYPHVLPPPGGGGFEEERTGTHLGGGGDPLPGPHPRGDTPAVHSMGRSRRRTGYGFPLAIAMTALAPGRGRGRSAQRGRGGGCRRGTFGYHFARGGDEPPPRSPPPVAISPRSTPRGELREEPDSGQLFPVFPFPPGKPTPLPLPGTVYPGYRHDCPRPWEGAGEERAARAGRGLPERDVRVSPPGRPGGVRGRRGALRLGWDEGQIGSVHLESMH
jgi:hypothetical protein